jgi:hypothetical protein
METAEIRLRNNLKMLKRLGEQTKARYNRVEKRA